MVTTHSDLEVDGHLVTTYALGSKIFDDGIVGVDVGRVLDIEWEGNVGVSPRWELDIRLVATANQCIVDGVVNLKLGVNKNWFSPEEWAENRPERTSATIFEKSTAK